MSATNQIRYIEHREVDKLKWNRCIDEAANGLIYAYSDYLDCMAPGWHALVLKDYEAVMPLTWNRKYGFHYLYQPFLSASLGVFGNHMNAILLEEFLKAIPAKFKYWDIYLNHGNFFRISTFDLYERMNYVLDLNATYETLYKNFRENVKRNIKKAAKLGCVLRSDFKVEDVIELSVIQMETFARVKDQDFEHFKMLYYRFREKGKAMTYGIFNTRNELISSCVFFFSHNRAYYILVGNHPDGKTIGAGHALINEFIKEHANQSLLLDFEGSDVHNIAFFYSSFGATEEKYPGIKYNKLPAMVKWLKD